MNASAGTPAKQPRRTVAVRLADPAGTLASVSLIFGLLLVFFPISFPRIITQNWQHGRLTLAMILFTVSLNLGHYLHVAHQRSAKPGLIAPACLGGAPVFIVAGFSLILLAAVAHTLSGGIPNALAQTDEEILAQTFFGTIAAIFCPFLVIRFAQQFQKTNSARQVPPDRASALPRQSF